MHFFFIFCFLNGFHKVLFSSFIANHDLNWDYFFFVSISKYIDSWIKNHGAQFCLLFLANFQSFQNQISLLLGFILSKLNILKFQLSVRKQNVFILTL